MFGIMQQKLCKAKGGSTDFRFSYCGTCKSIGTTYGHKSRLFLNYDVVFLSTILNDLHKENSYSTSYSAKSCWNLPKSQEIPIVFKYTSALNVYLAGIKIRDNIKDSKWYNKLKWLFTKYLYFRDLRSARKTLKGLGFPIKKVEDLVDESFRRENKMNLSLENYAEPTSMITQIAFQHGAELINAKSYDTKILQNVGNSLGKLAYCIDAKEDHEEDCSKGTFNPIFASDKITTESIGSEIANQCDFMMDNLTFLNFTHGLKSKYLLRLASLKTNELNEKKERIKNRSDNFWCDVCCCECCTDCDCSNSKNSMCGNSNDSFCCDSGNSSCCDTGCESCGDCGCDGCCVCD